MYFESHSSVEVLMFIDLKLYENREYKSKFTLSNIVTNLQTLAIRRADNTVVTSRI